MPDWVAPQLSKLVEITPNGSEWAHEFKFDGYRMHARIAGRSVRLLTRTGLDWTERFPHAAKAFRSLGGSLGVCRWRAVRQSTVAGTK